MLFTPVCTENRENKIGQNAPRLHRFAPFWGNLSRAPLDRSGDLCFEGACACAQSLLKNLSPLKM